MKYGKYGAHDKIKNTDKDYIEQRKIINMEELVEEFEKQARIQLSQYSSIFGKFEKYGGEVLNFPMNTALSKENLKKFTLDFFSKINSSLYEQVEEVFNVGEDADPLSNDVVLKISNDSKLGEGDCARVDIAEEKFLSQFSPELIKELKENDPKTYAIMEKMMKPRSVLMISMAQKGNISDLYNLVHELTHYFSLRQRNCKWGMFEEVGPHCMERLVDYYLLSLTEKECEELNTTTNKIKEDVILRNIITFALRYYSAKRFNKEKGETAVKQEDLKYILALMYQSKFTELDLGKMKEIILPIIECVRDNDFNRINEIFNIKWDDKLQRGNIVNKPIVDVLRYLKSYEKILADTNQKKADEMRDSDIR